MKLYAKEKGFTFPYLYDGDTQVTAKAYGCLATPHVFLFDQELRIRAESVSANYDGQVAAALKSGKVDPAQLIAARSQSRHTGRAVEILVVSGGGTT